MLELIVGESTSPRSSLTGGNLVGPFVHRQTALLFVEHVLICKQVDAAEHLVKVNGEWFVATHWPTRKMQSE